MSLRKKVSGAVAAAVIVSATPFIAKWEGLETKAYRDIVGIPTVCYGETRGVKMGDTYTKEQCMDMLKVAVGDYYRKIEPCMTNKNIPVGVQASILELAYNVGTGAACKSTMMKLANKGKYKEACRELDKWVKAGGQTVRGLQNRRADSKVNLCLKGIQ
jgi:GH24 family phage-related lysozyme (muramidase)